MWRAMNAFMMYANTTVLTRDSDLDLNTGLQADAGLEKRMSQINGTTQKKTHNLFYDLTRGVKIDETLVNLQLITVPGLGTFTARLSRMSDFVGRNL